MQPRRVKSDEDRFNRRTENATRKMIRMQGQPIDTLGHSAAAAIQFEANRRASDDAALATLIGNETLARQQADAAEATARAQADTNEAATRSQADTALGGRIDTLGTSTAAGLNAEAATRAAADALRVMRYGSDGKAVSNPREYAHTLPVVGAAGQAVFYLTDNGLASGVALFASIRTVQPQVNDGTTVYGFGWVISADMKTLTMTVRKSATPVLSLLGINILGAPAIAPAGTLVNVFVAGS